MSSNGVSERPRVLFVGRTRYRLPLPGWLAKKWDALERQLDFRVIASASSRDDVTEHGRFRLLRPARPRALDGVLFYLRCPLAVRRQIREFRPEAIVAESPYTGMVAIVGRALTPGHHPRVVVEVHGDWRTATRLYGSPTRRLLNPFADRVSRLALRRGDAVRAVSPYTGGLVEDVRGIPVTATFPTYTDLQVFSGRPPDPIPNRPVALFVGMLEYYKNVDGLVVAWREVVGRLPGARLVIVGDGSKRELVERLVADFPHAVEWHRQLPPEEVARKLDQAMIFVLPSRSEGLPRVLIEAFARGRGAVGGTGGGIPELVHDGSTGLLVDPEDPAALADALVRALSDRELCERFGRAAYELYASVHTTPSEYASRVRRLVESCLRESGVRPGERTRVLVVSAGEHLPPTEDGADPTLLALRNEIDYCLLARAPRGVRPLRTAVAPGSVQLVRRRAGPLDSLAFYGGLPFRVAALVRRFRPAVVIAETPHVGFLVLVGLSLRRRGRPSLVVETHGDWRTAVRLGGSRLRVLLAPFADWSANYALRHSDALRAVSPFTAGLAERAAGVPPMEAFPTYTDLAAFTDRPPVPLPDSPAALFVGMLERTKDLGLLVRAWPKVVARVPAARLTIVGRGALVELVERLRDDFPGQIEHHPELTPREVAEQMDAATVLVLPSRSEGFGRVIVEAYARGRPVIGTRVGSIPDLVHPGVTGLLVEPGDADGLARAIVSLFIDPTAAADMAEAALKASRAYLLTPDDYAARVRTLVDRTLAASAR
jgi:glycosyltransferase involved in cell wall biosynthesis